MSYPTGMHFRQHAQPPTPTPTYSSPDSLWSAAPPPRSQSGPQISPHTVTLTMKQHPSHALATADGKEKTRKPIDPPPIVQMDVDERADPNRHYLFSPHLFVLAALLPEGAEGVNSKYQKGVIGETCSAIHRLKDTDNKEGGFFVFGDISVRKPGRYRLHFSLFNNESGFSYNLVAETVSDYFTVYSSKDFTGMDESTPISRSFNEQGVRLRMRKEPRSRQVASHPPEPEDSQLASHHYGNYAQMSQPRNYAAQPVYHALSGDRGMKRSRDDDNELRVPPSQIPRTTYYQNPYQPPQQQQYSGLVGLGQQYPSQHQQTPQQYLPQALHQPTFNHHYFNNQIGNIDPDIFK